MRGEMETGTGDTVTILRLRTDNHIPPTQIIKEVWTSTAHPEPRKADGTKSCSKKVPKQVHNFFSSNPSDMLNNNQYCEGSCELLSLNLILMLTKFNHVGYGKRLFLDDFTPEYFYQTLG